MSRREEKNTTNPGVEELIEKIKNHTISYDESVENAINKIKKIDPKIKACISTPVVNGKDGMLKGIPFAVKDNMEVVGTRTTCASKILENYVSPYTATAVQKILDKGATLVAKTNMDEFAMGASTEYSAFFTTKNPLDPERVPGGSSGGSAAAVASGMVPFALGSDTGGSIRQPASFCGLVGYKPTYGLVSRYGLVAFASSLDQIGPITQNVRDAALIGEIIFGRDPKDSTTVEKNLSLLKEIENSIKNFKFAVPKEFVRDLNPDVKKIFEESIDRFKKMDVKIEEVSIPSLKYSVAVYYIIAPAEASSNLARYDGIRYGLSVEGKSIDEVYMKTKDEGFGREVKRRIMIGTFTLSATYYDAYFDKAQRTRAKIVDEMNKIFDSYDAIIGPTTPNVAFKIGQLSSPLEYYLQDIYTIPANLAGLPAVSLPMGKIGNMPVGLQIMCKRFEDDKMLRIARNYEKVSQR
ncbi:MAG: Asp-tRNA(Asn)/Glu-tRNA(Gln) amidotransferase GatCAB subunit A [Mesoaciditoga sp.]|nr:MAG: Asp-tRNA(Asn)/Glu-tRNA(Gln) amidotransferase GatCAB subunit A [Mesoaciditoga sp.]HEU23863.1 Asp-tRNA(Asn)/Glu-tRNA(Gln) amidotransferase subunit GatA [Mesoaciditoga lauensis]